MDGKMSIRAHKLCRGEMFSEGRSCLRKVPLYFEKNSLRIDELETGKCFLCWAENSLSGRPIVFGPKGGQVKAEEVIKIWNRHSTRRQGNIRNKSIQVLDKTTL